MFHISLLVYLFFLCFISVKKNTPFPSEWSYHFLLYHLPHIFNRNLLPLIDGPNLNIPVISHITFSTRVIITKITTHFTPDKVFTVYLIFVSVSFLNFCIMLSWCRWWWLYHFRKLYLRFSLLKYSVTNFSVLNNEPIKLC